MRTKASDRVEILQGELELIESSADEDFGDFLAITAELVIANPLTALTLDTQDSIYIVLYLGDNNVKK